MTRILIILALAISIFSSCRSTRKIQTVVTPKDTTTVMVIPKDTSHEDSLRFISETYRNILGNHIDFTTFSAKIDVDYQDAEGKKYNVNAHIRMYKDSVIWISITAIFGIEGLRAYITSDSVKLLNKQDKVYTARSVEYLQDVTALPLDLPSLQNLLLGNPVFLDSNNIISYMQSDNTVTLLSLGDFFKNLFTVDKTGKLTQSSKLDDLDELRNRTCYLAYSDYENKKGVNFSTKRRITVTEAKKLDIKLDFKQYDFNEMLSFPFSVPKNYKAN
jgi:Domain of unknown function (DUF4292)